MQLPRLKPENFLFLQVWLHLKSNLWVRRQWQDKWNFTMLWCVWWTQFTTWFANFRVALVWIRSSTKNERIWVQQYGKCLLKLGFYLLEKLIKGTLRLLGGSACNKFITPSSWWSFMTSFMLTRCAGRRFSPKSGPLSNDDFTAFRLRLVRLVSIRSVDIDPFWLKLLLRDLLFRLTGWSIRHSRFSLLTFYELEFENQCIKGNYFFLIYLSQVGSPQTKIFPRISTDWQVLI